MYLPDDEIDWIRCRVLAFLNTAYFDNVLNKKEKYESSAIELVVEENGKVVGLLDIECEENPKTICTNEEGLGGMIWHIATHPDFQRRGIGAKMLEKAEEIAKAKGLDYLEAWTRDDEWVNEWYVKNGFEQVYTYLHVFAEGEKEIKKVMRENDAKFQVMQAFAHYAGDKQEDVMATFGRVHKCRCYIKMIKQQE